MNNNNSFAAVYVHAIEYNMKIQQYTRILLDSFANMLTHAFSSEYGLDNQKLTARARTLIDTFVKDPDEKIPICKAMTYRGKPCHKRACLDNDGYCDVHKPPSKRPRVEKDDPQANIPAGEFSRVSKLLRLF